MFIRIYYIFMLPYLRIKYIHLNILNISNHYITYNMKYIIKLMELYNYCEFIDYSLLIKLDQKNKK